MTRLRFALEAAAFRTLLLIARFAPRGFLRTLGGALGRVAFALDRRHRKVTLDNLRDALGAELDASERGRLARLCWRNLGRNVLDALTFSRMGPQAIGTTVRYEGLQHIRQAYARGRGVLLFSAHYGQWELTALMQGYLELPLVLITRPLDNPALERLLADLRGRTGNRIVHKRNAVREMVKALRGGLGVAIVIDQDAGRDGLFVPFFGRPASTTPTLARIALRTGAAVVPTFSVPREDGTYDVHYGPPVEVRRTDDLEADALRLTAACTAIIESWVRRHPEHWFWMHRRWKTAPPPDAATRLAAANEERAHG